MKRITSKEFEFLIARKPSPDTRGTYYVIDDKRVRWGPTYTDAADKNSETLRQAREALLQSAAALHVIAQSLEGADEPAPMERPKANGGWITDKLPTEMDANFENDVKVPNVLDKACPYEWAKYYTVQLGAPWCSPDDTPAPWDPTCLDRNGWIRSRLPTVEDANDTGLVLLPMGNGGVNSVIAYNLIVPGQPWAPWGSNPGVFEK